MPILLSDEEIEELVLEPKLMPDGLCTPKMAVRNSHRHKSYEIPCDSGHLFVVKIRESCVNPMNFSVILGNMLPGVYTVFRLKRYNGKSHFHSNPLENEKFYDFHVHQATARYQRPGFNEDHYAVPTQRFCNLQTALGCLVDECGFPPPFKGTPLFPLDDDRNL
jgi:hypothetical protein